MPDWLAIVFGISGGLTAFGAAVKMLTSTFIAAVNTATDKRFTAIENQLQQIADRVGVNT